VGRKRALRAVGLDGLDPALFERPKRGFVLPIDQWIRRGLGREMDATMRDESMCRAAGLSGKAVGRLWSAYRSGSSGLYWSRVWATYVLIRWCHRHNVFAA
jgi:asparagine synthase (glutamine-hydrolysing)